MEGITEPSLFLMCYDLMSGKETQPSYSVTNGIGSPCGLRFFVRRSCRRAPWDAEAVTLTLVAAAGGDRLDKWLVGQLPERSRSEVQRWIEAGLVSAGSRPLRASHRIVAGAEITVIIPATDEVAVEPEPIPLDICTRTPICW